MSLMHTIIYWDVAAAYLKFSTEWAQSQNM